MKAKDNNAMKEKKPYLSLENLKWMLTTDDNGDGTVSPGRLYMALFDDLPSSIRYKGEHMITSKLTQLLQKNYKTCMVNDVMDSR